MPTATPEPPDRTQIAYHWARCMLRLSVALAVIPDGGPADDVDRSALSDAESAVDDLHGLAEMAGITPAWDPDDHPGDIAVAAHRQACAAFPAYAAVYGPT